MENTIQFGLVFSAVGISIVFIVLLLISATVSLMRYLDNRRQQVTGPTVENETPPKMVIDNITLVLITAAVTAAMKKSQFKINSIKRVHSRGARSQNWSLQGRAVLHGSHVVNVPHDNKN